MVIPAYKEEGYIGKCLKALTQQTVKPHCVVVALYAPGGVRDATVVISQAYGARVVGVDRPGIGPARSIGVDATHAEAILNIDADSEPAPDFAERLLDALDHGDVAAFGFGNWREEEATLAERAFVGLYSMFKELIPNGQCYGGLMVGREAYYAVGGFRDVPFEDTDLSFRLALAFPFRVRYVPEAFAYTSARRLRGLLEKNPLAYVDYMKAYRKDGEETVPPGDS